jgi:hypothetical protein
LEVFTAKDPVFIQSREGPCSKAAIWSTSAFSDEVPATFPREKHTGNYTPFTTGFVVQITFPSLREGVALLLREEGEGALGQVQWGSQGLCAQEGSRTTVPLSVVECGVCWLPGAE